MNFNPIFAKIDTGGWLSDNKEEENRTKKRMSHKAATN